MKIIPLILLFFALVLEVSVTTMPLVLIVLVTLAVFYRDYSVFVLSLIFGILLDILCFRQIGLSSIFFTLVIFLILIYQKKFEIETVYFAALSVGVSSFIFLLLQKSNYLFFQTSLSILLGISLFIFFKKMIVRKAQVTHN